MNIYSCIVSKDVGFDVPLSFYQVKLFIELRPKRWVIRVFKQSFNI